MSLVTYYIFFLLSSKRAGVLFLLSVQIVFARVHMVLLQTQSMRTLLDRAYTQIHMCNASTALGVQFYAIKISTLGGYISLGYAGSVFILHFNTSLFTIATHFGGVME